MEAITEAQINHYRLFGYVVIRGLVTPYLPAIDAEFKRLTQFDAHDGKSRKLVWQFLDNSAILVPLLDELSAVFDGVLGAGWQYFGSVGNIYSGDTGWHPDNFSHHPRTKVALYLDSIGPGQGGLSVMPMSHRVAREMNDVHLAVGMSMKSIGLQASEIPCVTLSTEPGDAVVFNQNLMHASFNGGDKRRMISINAHARYRDDQRDTLEDDVCRLSRFLAPDFYGPEIMRTTSESRASHLDQVLSCTNVYHDSLTRRLAVTNTQAKDLLLDLSNNMVPEVVIAELLRDNDYAAPAEWLQAMRPRFGSAP